MVYLAVPLLLLSAGCRTILNIENPEYSIRDVRARPSIAIPLSASSVNVDFLIEINNPNSVGLRLDRIDFDLLVDGTRVLSGVSSQNIRIPAKGFGDVQVRTRVGYENLRLLSREVIDMVRGDRAKYELKGRVFYDTPLGKMEFPLTIYRREL